MSYDYDRSELSPVAVECSDCGDRCPYTDETDPPLTHELGDSWYDLHKLLCPQR
jgi:hypothetical protein